MWLKYCQSDVTPLPEKKPTNQFSNRQRIYLQGLNAIDAAIQCGVKHIIFNGSENVKKIIGKECNHLDSKSAIEEYIREVGEYNSQYYYL
jgi:hypothetical protein